jgi:BioD-like phosphotransacetylase family protein
MNATSALSLNSTTTISSSHDQPGFLQGSYALRKLTARCDELMDLNLKNTAQVAALEQANEQLQKEKRNLKKDLMHKINTIAEIKQNTFSNEKLTRSCRESELLLSEEIKKRKHAVNITVALMADLEQYKDDLSCKKADFEEAMRYRDLQEQENKELQDKVDRNDQVVNGHLFNKDELNVTVAKLLRTNESLERQMA